MTDTAESTGLADALAGLRASADRAGKARRKSREARVDHYRHNDPEAAADYEASIRELHGKIREVREHPDVDEHTAEQVGYSAMDVQMGDPGNPAALERLDKLPELQATARMNRNPETRDRVDAAVADTDSAEQVEVAVPGAGLPSDPGAGLPGDPGAGLPSDPGAGLPSTPAPGSDPMGKGELQQRSRALLREYQNRPTSMGREDFAHKHHGMLGGDVNDAAGDAGNADALAAALGSLEDSGADLDDRDTSGVELAALLGRDYDAALPAERRPKGPSGSVTGNNAYPGSGDVTDSAQRTAPEDEPGWGTIQANRSHLFRRDPATGELDRHPRSAGGEWTPTQSAPPSAKNIAPSQAAADLGGVCLDCGRVLTAGSATGYGPECVKKHR